MEKSGVIWTFDEELAWNSSEFWWGIPSQTCWFISITTHSIVSSSCSVDFPCFRLFCLVSYRSWSREGNERNEDSEQRYSLFLFFLLPYSSSSSSSWASSFSLSSSLPSSSDLDLNQHHLRRPFQHHRLSFSSLLLLTLSPSGIHWFLFGSRNLIIKSGHCFRLNKMILLEALHLRTERLPCLPRYRHPPTRSRTIRVNPLDAIVTRGLHSVSGIPRVSESISKSFMSVSLCSPNLYKKV